MKQHITVEQLHNYIKPNGQYDGSAVENCFIILGLPKDKILMSDYFTIGKMIEVLEEHKVEWYDRIFSVDYDHNIYKSYDGEICDKLWEEVKRIM